MTMPPIVLATLLVATLLAKYMAGFTWIPAIAVGLVGAGIVGFALGGRKAKTGIWMVAGGVVLYILAPQLATLSVPAPAEELAIASWSVTPATVTSGLSISGNQIIVPLTYNSTANSLDKDPVVIQFTVTRTDTGTNDASFTVEVTPASKITDPATGLQYEAVEKDSLQRYKIYIGSGTEFQDTKRVYPMKYGTSQQAFNVTIDLNPKGFDYLNNYESTTGSINVAGQVYTIVFQKISESS